MEVILITLVEVDEFNCNNIRQNMWILYTLLHSIYIYGNQSSSMYLYIFTCMCVFQFDLSTKYT